MVYLDAAGQTTIIYKLKFGEMGHYHDGDRSQSGDR